MKPLSVQADPGLRPRISSTLAKTGLTLTLATALMAPGAAISAPNSAHNSKGAPAARNIILLIGDGMGDPQLTAARYYEYGAKGRLTLDSIRTRASVTTYSVREDDPTVPDYVPDSASTGTAWATGAKTSDGRISTTPNSNLPLTTILELAQSAGFRTGDVTTARVTDATPAVLVSHVASRDCEGPEDMAACPQDNKVNGGPGSIAEQAVDHGVDVLLGGGQDRFDETIQAGSGAGRTVAQYATRNLGYTLVNNRSELDQIQPGQKVLGLLSSGTMEVELTGDGAASYPGTGPQTCAANPARPADSPSLAAMTSRALDLLGSDNPQAASGLDNAGNGSRFFLQVEGASIDKQDHAANPCGQIGETVAFDNAVGVALNYAKRHPRTLVIVTADHAHTSQIIPEGQMTPGLVSTLITKDNADLALNYATAMQGESQSHTGDEVPIFAKGPRSKRVRGVIDQTKIFSIMRNALSMPRTQNQSKTVKLK